jgi:hypothetical protein
MACAESITDNANAWTVSFTLSDATSGETLLAQEVSADNSIVWVYS